MQELCAKKQFDSLTFFRLFHRQYEQTVIVLGLKTGNEIQTFEPRRYKLFSWNSVMASEELQRQQHRIPRITFSLPLNPGCVRV